MLNLQQSKASSKPRFKGYTLPCWIALYVALFSILSDNQTIYNTIALAFGVPLGIWLYVCFVGGIILLSIFPTALIHRIYGQFSKQWSRYDQNSGKNDLPSYTEAGGDDINFWSSVLSFIITVYVFGRVIPAHMFAGFRPYLVLLILVIVAQVLTRVIANSVFATLYQPRLLQTSYLRLPCQQTFLWNQYCHYTPHDGGKWCLWHKILHEFRDEYGIFPRWAVITWTINLAGAFYIAASSLWLFSLQPNVLWLFLLLAAIGLGGARFAQLVMINNYPLAQFAGWVKLEAGALVSGILGGIAAIICIPLLGSKAIEPVVTFFMGDNFLSHHFGLLFIILFIGLLTIFNLYELLRRFLFLRIPDLTGLLVICWLILFLSQILASIFK